MLTRSADYIALMGNANHRVEWKISVNGTDYGMGDISSSVGGGVSLPHLNRSLFTGSTPTVGGCVAATFECTIFEASENVPRMATVVPSYRLVAPDETPSEWITLGTFYIDTRTVDQTTGALSLYCYDRMLVADGAGGAIYSDLTAFTEWPQSMADVVDEIAGIMGVTVDSRTVINTGVGYVVGDPKELTMREVLGYIAAAHAGNFTITPENKLRLVTLAGGSDTFTLGTATTDLSTAPKLSAWTGVVVQVNDKTSYQAGYHTGRILTCECPWATQETATGILNAIFGDRYQPYTANGAFPDLALELGDVITSGFTGETVTGPVFSIDITCEVLESASLSAPGESEIDHEYPYIPVTSRRIRQMQWTLDEIEETLPDQIDQQLEVVLLRAVRMDFADWDNGEFYEILDDGTVCYYTVTFDQSNRPILITDGDHTCVIAWGS